MASKFNKSNRAEYERDGVTKVTKVLDQHSVRALRIEIERLATNGTQAFVTHKDKGDSGASHIGAFMHKQSKLLDELARNSKISELARSFFEHTPFHFFYDQLFVKEPNTETRTQWHQDLPYWPLSGTEVPSFWIALTKTDANRSAVAYLPGSHVNERVYEPINHENRSSAQACGISVCPDFHKNEGYIERIRTFDLAPGDVIVHHPLVAHGAGPNRSRSPRVAISLRYASENTIWAPRPSTMFFPDSDSLSPGIRLADQSVFRRVTQPQ